MSLYINFEPHSYYKGFAIKNNKVSGYDNFNLEREPVDGFKYTGYTDNGNTYTVIECHANTLKELKRIITDYRSK